MSMSSTNPGDRSAAQIEAEVDQERQRVAGTIDALQSKLSMQGMVEQASQALYEHGGDLGRTLGRQLRDNPMAAMLTGLGLAWLMAGSGSRQPYRGEGRGEEDEYRTGQPVGLTNRPDPTWRGEAVGQGLADRAAEWSDKVAQAASGAVHSTREAMGSAREALTEGGRSLRQGGHSARDWSGRKAQGMQDVLASGIDANPLVFGGIAFALGAALGAALPRTRAEDEFLGPHADRMKESVSAIASDEAQKAKAVASAVIEEGKQIVQEAAGSLAENMPDADALAERTREAALDAADRLRTAGETEAERRKLGEPGSAT
jgi:uncharacterized protein DUF3618